MYRVTVSAFALGFMLTSVTSADLALPSHLKYVDPLVRFEGIEEHQDHVFFVCYYSTGGNPDGCPPSLVEVKNSVVFKLGAHRRIFRMAVLSILRKDLDKRKADDRSVSWIDGKPMKNGQPALSWLRDLPEARYTPVEHPPTLASTFGSEGETVYQVSIQAGRLWAHLVSKPSPPSENVVVDLMQTWVFGVLVAVSLACLGIWFARRLWRNAKAESAPCEETPPS
jgi:hypothetical protein